MCHRVGLSLLVPPLPSMIRAYGAKDQPRGREPPEGGREGGKEGGRVSWRDERGCLTWFGCSPPGEGGGRSIIGITTVIIITWSCFLAAGSWHIGHFHTWVWVQVAMKATRSKQARWVQVGPLTGTRSRAVVSGHRSESVSASTCAQCGRIHQRTHGIHSFEREGRGMCRPAS